MLMPSHFIMWGCLVLFTMGCLWCIYYNKLKNALNMMLPESEQGRNVASVREI